MPVDVGGGGGGVQEEIATVWGTLAQSCRTKADELAGIPVLGPILAGAFNSLGSGFEQADTFTRNFSTLYDRLTSAVDAVFNGEGIGEILDRIFPGWRLIATDPQGWLIDKLPFDLAAVQALLSGTVEDAAERLGEALSWLVNGLTQPMQDTIDELLSGNQYAYWLTHDPPRLLSEIVREWYPGLYQFMTGNNAWFIDWSYEIAQGLINLPESIRRELGQALFGLLGLEGIEGEDLIITLIKKAFEWIEAHLPDFKEIALTAMGKVLRYFLEGAM